MAATEMAARAAKAGDLFPGLEEANAAAAAGDVVLAVVLRIGRVIGRNPRGHGAPVDLMKSFFAAAKAYAEAFDRQAETERGTR